MRTEEEIRLEYFKEAAIKSNISIFEDEYTYKYKNAVANRKLLKLRKELRALLERKTQIKKFGI